MMWRASLASSRAVISWRGSGRPLELPNVDLGRPSSRARLVIISANSDSVPAMPSASAMQASLADWMMTPCSRSSTATLLWIGMNMLEVCEGAPPRRQALVLTRNSVVGLSLSCLIRLNTSSAVISLDKLAGGMSSSADFSNSTVPLSASIRMACGAAVWNPPSLDFGPDTGLGAAKPAPAAQARTRAMPHFHNDECMLMAGDLIRKTGSFFGACSKLRWPESMPPAAVLLLGRRRSVEPAPAHQAERRPLAAHRGKAGGSPAGRHFRPGVQRRGGSGAGGPGLARARDRRRAARSG